MLNNVVYITVLKKKSPKLLKIALSRLYFGKSQHGQAQNQVNFFTVCI